MAAAHKKRPYGKTILFGLAVFALYTTLYIKQDLINATFIKGGVFAFLPIAAAFLFSFVHGSFTGGFWSSLGIEASKKAKEVKQPCTK